MIQETLQTVREVREFLRVQREEQIQEMEQLKNPPIFWKTADIPTWAGAVPSSGVFIPRPTGAFGGAVVGGSAETQVKKAKEDEKNHTSK